MTPPRTGAPLVLAVLAAAGSAQEVAERARHPETGHTYVRTDEPMAVLDAEQVARAMGGTLVAITTAEEETFLLENFGTSEPYWVGLEFPRQRWATGEPVAHTHWFGGEPGGAAGEPFTLMNWDEYGTWGDTNGDAESGRFRALVELEAGVEPRPVPLTPAARRAKRGVLLLAVQGLGPRDVQNPRYASLNGLWKRSAWTGDAAADGSGDALASLGMLVWGVGSSKSLLSSANPRNAARHSNENLLARLERFVPDVTTASLLDDPALTGTLMDGRVDLRVSNASARKGGSPEPLADALARATPLCAVVAWTDVRPPGEAAPSEAARARELAAVDAEIGALLALLRARPAFAEEDWWIALAGLTSVAGKKEKPDDLRARSAVPLCIVASSAPPGEILDEIALVDLVPSALAHLALEPRPGWNLDGRVLDLARAAGYGRNLIVNGGAEDQFGWSQGAFPVVTGWRQLGGFLRARHDEASGTAARGESYFQGSGETLARLEQTIDLRALAADIERGDVRFRLAGSLGARKRTAASIECALEFLTEQRKPLERAALGPIGPGERREAPGTRKGEPLLGLIELETRGKVPRRARAARVILSAEGASGVDQVMADDLSLVLERD